MEVQGLQAGLIWGYPANAAYAAVAIRAASTVLTITNHGELRRQNADGSSSAPLSFASHQLGDLTATYEQSGSVHLSTGSGHSWRIHFPGGGSLLAGSWPAARAMPAGFIYGLWLSVPPAAVASATGLCAGSFPAASRTFRFASAAALPSSTDAIRCSRRVALPPLWTSGPSSKPPH